MRICTICLLYTSTASFLDGKTIEVKGAHDTVQILSASKFIINTGARPMIPAAVSYTHLDVYKRQVLWISLDTGWGPSWASSACRDSLSLFF